LATRTSTGFACTGYRDEQIAEVGGLVALQLLTGAFNLIADIHATPEALAEINAEAER